MSSLRDIVRRHIEDETLNELIDIPPDKRPSMIEYLRKEGHIDKKVKEVLDVYNRELEEAYVTNKAKKKLWKAGYTLISAILTILISYFVNETQWVAIWALAFVQVVFALLFIFIDE